MTKRFVVLLIAAAIGVPVLIGAEATPSASPSEKKKEKKPSSEKKEQSAAPKSNPLGATATDGPITTEIFADEAFFDSNKSIGIFTGKVKVTDPRFNLQSDKLTVFITKGENQAMEKAIAEGNVAVVRDRPDPNGGPPTHAVGRSETATYIAATGDVELKGMPRVQQGLNTHIATSPETVMVITQDGQLTTHGASRTEIRQEPKDATNDKSKADNKTQPSPKQSPKASPKP
jgi:lipopolysaccharide transport protein LptA